MLSNEIIEINMTINDETGIINTDVLQGKANASELLSKKN